MSTETTNATKCDNLDAISKSEQDMLQDKSRQKLNAIESIKFLAIIAANIEQIHYYAFAKKQADEKKGSILKGFYKIIKCFLEKSASDYNCGRSVSVLKSHLHRILPKRADMERYVNDNNLFEELRITGDKINRTMLSKLVILLFKEPNYKKLIEFRFSVLKKNNSEYWCEVNSENFRPLLRLLEQLLGENYLHFQNLLLKPHNMSLEYNTSSDFSFH